MKAIIYTEYGSPDVLRLAEVPQPTPQDNEILVQVRAVAINYGDLIARDFKHMKIKDFNMPGPFFVVARLSFGWNKPRNPILGSEFAGVVTAVGKDVTRFQVGDDVFGYKGQNMGANAEYLCVAEDSDVAHKPANVSYAEAAVVPYGALTALSLLRRVDIQAGQKVLINGASGSIGSAAVQFAKQAGAEVTGVCGTRRMAYVQALGADKVLDYTQEDFTQNGEQYDVIFDVLGRSSFGACRRSLTPHGRYLLASFKTKQALQMLQTKLSGNQKVICALAAENTGDLPYIAELLEAGKYKSIVDKSFPLAEAAEAHRYVAQGRHGGKVALTLGAEGHSAESAHDGKTAFSGQST